MKLATRGIMCRVKFLPASQTIRLVGACVAIAAAVLALAVAAATVLDGDLDELAGWIEALATLAAFSAAVVAAIFVARTYTVERAREDRWHDTEKRAQAALVAAWSTGDTSHGTGIPDPYSGETLRSGIDSSRVVVRNASNLPVRDVHMKLEIQIEEPDLSLAENDGVIGLRRTFGTRYLEMVPPGDEPVSHWIEASKPIDPYAEGFSGEHKIRFHLAMRYTDAAGNTWERDHVGRLAPVDVPAPLPIPISWRGKE